jgi:hypothetical protein
MQVSNEIPSWRAIHVIIFPLVYANNQVAAAVFFWGFIVLLFFGMFYEINTFP